ncbi:MAG: ABC transporter permease [Bacteroidota bacterium]
MKPSPPSLLLRFFRWFCHPELHPFIEGDLLELYEERVKEQGRWKANIQFALNVLLLFRPGIIRPFNRKQPSNYYTMYQSYFKIGWRNLRKHPKYSFINIGGLTLGLTACLLIFMFVNHEISFDRFHYQADHIFRVAMKLQRVGEVPPTLPGGINTAPNLGPALEGIAGVESFVRFRKADVFIEREDNGFFEKNFLFADPSILDVFYFPLAKGDPKAALANPFTLVISQSVAKKYFGDLNPIGAFLTVDDTLTFEVAGVLKPIPDNSHIQVDFLTSLATYESIGGNLDQWWGHDYTTYVKLANGVDQQAVADQVYDISQQHIADAEANLGLKQKHFLEPLTNVYLHSQVGNNLGPIGSISHVYIFSVIAILALLIACINFMNLATAQSTRRAKEVGVRKVLGSRYNQLVRQFLSESFLMVLFALLVALFLTVILLPFFNQLTGKNLPMSTLWTPTLLLIMLSFLLIVSLLAGGYPALVLSSFKPITALKGTVQLISGSSWLRKTLVVIQFAISTALIVGTLVVYSQLYFMQDQELGFDREQVVIISGQELADFDHQYDVLKQELEKQPGITKVSISSAVPGKRLVRITAQPEGLPDDEVMSMQTLAVDDNFLNTYGLTLVAGRGFSPQSTADSAEAFILNETAVRELGWNTAEEAIGKKFAWNLEKRGQVIGVVNDFHHQSLQQKIAPVVLHIHPSMFQYISLKVKTSDMQETLTNLEETWTAIVPSRPFNYSFLDENFRQQYQTEEKLGKVFSIFTVLAILIACIGLFGMTAFITEQRTKEIGVRKVLGASASSILILLSKDLVILIGIAFLLATPISYMIMNEWLGNFAYQVSLSPITFLIAGTATLLLGWFTMGFQSIKAALANPVDSLRNE